MRAIILLYGPCVGMEDHVAVLLETDDVNKTTRADDENCADLAIEHLNRFGYEYAPDCDEDDWDDSYMVQEFNYGLEVYDPEKHDCYRVGGGSFTEDFERLEA